MGGEQRFDLDELAALGAGPQRGREPLLYVGDELLLTRSDESGEPVARDENGRSVAPANIHCTLPEAFEQVSGHSDSRAFARK